MQEPDLKDYFYHTLFFAELKWLLVLLAAICGYKHANKETYKEHKNKKSFKTIRMLVIFASLFFAAEKYNERRFKREMRHLRESLTDDGQDQEMTAME